MSDILDKVPPRKILLDEYDSRPDTLKHIDQVRSLLIDAIVNLLSRCSVHDASKLVSPEVEGFDEYTPKLRSLTYGSEEYEACRAAMKVTLDHHYTNNSHHPEYYCWHCPVCNWQGCNQQHEKAPQGPNNSGVRYCPRCCQNGMLYESELILKPEFGIRGMSLLDLIEMVCDWKAATLRHDDGNILKSIEINQRRFGYSDELRDILLNTITELGM